MSANCGAYARRAIRKAAGGKGAPPRARSENSSRAAPATRTAVAGSGGSGGAAATPLVPALAAAEAAAPPAALTGALSASLKPGTEYRNCTVEFM